MAGEDEIEMTHLRLQDPPRAIKEEDKLVHEYLDQFTDDDEIETNEVYNYVFSHASQKLKAYMKMIEKTLEDAKRRGARV